MSVLHSRIMTQGNGNHPARPWSTAQTPLVMPLALVTYANEQALYGTLTPLVTADGAVIPAQSGYQVASPVPAPVVPAGRP
jgi:hypothetical protein